MPTSEIRQYIDDYTSIGLTVIPVEWDIEKKAPKSHRFWSDGEPLPVFENHNAIMIRTAEPFHCFDFDIKNTENKGLFHEWFMMVEAHMPDLLTKLYIEKTRNAGYHVWFRYPQPLKKLSLAESDKGAEVIALYAGGPLVYTYPTPGYQLQAGSMEDCINLTADEFEFLCSSCAAFNEYKPQYDPNNKAVSYPVGFESFCIAFDNNLSDEGWHTLLTTIGLTQINGYKYGKDDKYTAYKRNGSDSNAISAKVYFRKKRLMIFSASMPEYPNWHNKHDFPVWSLPPSFVIFYQNGRSWEKAIEMMTAISEAEGFDIARIKPYTGKFPMHIFPDYIRNSIFEVSAARSLVPEFVSLSALWTIASLAGTHYVSEFNGDGKNILFCLMAAPMSVGKTPAYKVVCENPLKEMLESSDKRFEKAVRDWEQEKVEAASNKQPFSKRKPRRYIPFASDGTTEGYVSLLQDQPNGLGVYHDEAETIINAGAFKQNNDAISFFTTAFSGGRLTQVRADRDKERIVPSVNMSLLMGTQLERLKNIFTLDRIQSGFASRFLIVTSDYIELNTDIDPFAKGKEMCEQWQQLLSELYESGEDFNSGNGSKITIQMTEDAKDHYRNLYRRNIKQANYNIINKREAITIGTEAKMSNYFPRLCQIIAIMHNNRQPVIDETIVQMAYDCFKYFAHTTVEILTKLLDEVETGLPLELDNLYKELPEKFTADEAKAACIKLNLKDRRFETAIRRKDFSRLFRKVEHGTYQKT